jgi:hypothetical protein
VTVDDLVDRAAARPMTDEERAQFRAHLEYMERTVARSIVRIRLPLWGLALLGAFIATNVAVWVETRADLRSVARVVAGIVSLLACAPLLLQGPPMRVPPSLTDPDAVRYCRRVRRFSWAMYVGTWILVALQAVLMIGRLVL